VARALPLPGLLLLALAAAAPVARAAEPPARPDDIINLDSPQLLVERACFLVTFRGQVIGKAETELREDAGANGDLLRLDTSESFLFAVPGRQAAQFSVRRTALMRRDWTPLLVTEETSGEDGGQTLVRIQGGKKAVFRGAAGREKEFPLPAGAVLAELNGRALAARGLLKPGARLAAAVPDLHQQLFVPQTAEVLGRRTVEGLTGELHLVEVRDAAGRPAWDLLVDERGGLQRLGAGELVRTRVDPAQAVLPAQPAALSAGTVPLAGRAERPWKLRRLVLELRLPESAEGLVPELAGQKAAAEGRKVTVTVAERRPDGSLPLEELSAEARRAALEPDGEPDWRQPEVRRLAAEVAGREGSGLRKGFLLARWVYRNLAKTLGGPAEASALEALRNRAGDCSEHAALFAALARAAGLPARTAWGLVASEDELRFHVWSEFHDGRSWVPVDAALGRFGLPACYLTLSYDREDAGARLFRFYMASRGTVLDAEEDAEGAVSSHR
jgi:hypothetical protein